MTKLTTIFERKIDRHIEGVIKADDDVSLREEVEEYVLTNEVAKRLENFLYAYNNYEGANGVWISGFFGSGKSHLLKMLAFLLENRDIDGHSTLDLFLLKCGENEILRGDLKRAVAIPSRSILFNIDQKADVIAKTEVDAVLAVFVKVFDEMFGYYGKQGHIAQFERDLDGRNLYLSFQEAYRDIAGYDWTSGREQSVLEGGNVDAAYAQVTGDKATDILKRYRDQYKMSIEDFAEQVKKYIDQQSPNFRLNFFVDEVGQYVADNTKLMTNLQTIAESLATKCRGQAWIIVTAQEEMDSVIGEMEQQQGQDFSKIQARFKNRMKLTSSDVAEVIQKRLLKKNDTGIQLLSTVYGRQQNNFKTLFDFADGATTYKNFQDRDHFIYSYPFIPYQFTLFQSAIQSLSVHNAFEGKHSSVGERSMLGVFQQVAVHIGDHQLGDLATFDLMFEGIRTALKSNIQRAILNAENHLDNEFAVQVLKALFLVKYVKGFRATLRNLAVLMLPRFEADLTALRERLQTALNLLEQQTYIQRNGEQYEFLTDEEKDVEHEIKATEVDSTAVADELGTLIFDAIITLRKIRYEGNKQDYAFTRKLDDRVLGNRSYELTIHVISPFHEHTGNKTILQSQAMGRDELLVIMPTNDLLLRDLTLYKQTDKYTRQNMNIAQSDSVRRILVDKQTQNQERHVALRDLVQDMLVQAELIVDGRDLEISSSDAKTRLLLGFQELIKRTYPNLRMLRGVTYTEQEVGRYLQPETTLLGDDSATFSEAEQELLAFINGNRNQGLRTTLKTAVNRFERKPYGWYLAAIQGNLAKLCARGKIELRRDSTPLEDEDLHHALTNTHGYENIILEPQIEYSAAQLRWLRDFYADFFSGPSQANEAKALGQATAVAFRELGQKLEGLRQQATHYPFLTALDEPIQRLKAVTGQPYDFYLTSLRQQEDALLDMKEGTIAPIQQFMSGNQRTIYDEARSFLQTQAINFDYINDTAPQQLQQWLDDPYCYRGNTMQQVKLLHATLQQQIEAQIQQEQEAAIQELTKRLSILTEEDEYQRLSSEQQRQLQQPFSHARRQINQQTSIPVIREAVHRFNQTEYSRLLSQMTTWANPPQPAPQGGTSAETTPSGKKPIYVAETKIHYTPHNAIRVNIGKAYLATETDVDEYLAQLKQALLDEIQQGHRISF